VPDALDLGQGRRQAEPRYRPEIAPGLGRRLAAAARSRRPRIALPEEVFRLPQEGVIGLARARLIVKRPCPVRGVFVFRHCERSEAIQPSSGVYGLLRFARNDEVDRETFG